jgi:hypothetical protein
VGAFQYFGGIDFSGAKEPLSNLWSAVAREEAGKLRIIALRPHAFRADLRSYVADGWRAGVGASGDEAILWGADFPFGLPTGAAEHLCGGSVAWQALAAWTADRPPDEIRDAVPEPLRTSRIADTGGAMDPLNVRLYRQTFEGIRWLHELREITDADVCPQARVPDAATTLIEVYPSATMRDLGVRCRRVPGRPGEQRARAAALNTWLSFTDASMEASALVLEDAWDAVIACLTAWLARDDLDQPFRVGSHPRVAISLEGWIYRPPAAVG